MPCAAADDHPAVTTAAPLRVLVVTDVALASDDPGAIFLRALLAGHRPDCLAVCEITSEASPLPPELAGAAHQHVRRPRERGLHRFGALVRRATRWPLEERLRRSGVPRVVRDVVAFGRARRVERVLVALNGTTVIAAAAAVARRLDIPLLTLVWDPPAYRLADGWGLGGTLLRSYLRDFDAALRASTRVAVMSETMRDVFLRRYGVETVLMRLGVPRQQWRSGGERGDTEFVIAYAGSLYARAEWDALLKALDLVDWRLAGRRVRVRILSGGFEARVSRPVRFEFLGWHAPEQAIDLLSEADLCYLPYWFAPRYTEVVQMSFPSKLSTYVAAGVPIFFHGPAKSSPAVFLSRYPAGVCCHAAEPVEIARALQRCAADDELRARSAAAGRVALEEELGLHVLHARFAELVGTGHVAPDAGTTP